MMEVRLQAQEDEITLLKSSLADALRKLQLHDQLLHLLKQQLIAGEFHLQPSDLLPFSSRRSSLRKQSSSTSSQC